MNRASTLALAALLTACGSAPRAAVAPPPATDPAAAAASDAGASDGTVAIPAQLGSWVDTFVGAFGEHYGEAYAFSGILLVAKDGKPVLARAYGKANRESGAVADADTRFLIGSITKQVTAVAILQLAEKGLVDLSAPLRKYLPDYPATGNRITLHQLLSHTSGVPDMPDAKLQEARDKPHAAKEVVASFADKPLDFEPGTKFAYSNSNYFLLGLVLEKVSGETYGGYIQNHCFSPAKMTSTTLLDAPSVANTAAGYVREGDKLAVAHRIDVSLPFSAGALRSTAMDLVRWDQALTGDLVLSAEWQKKMFTPVKEARKEGYGYGIFLDALGGHALHEHNGGIDGFAADLAGIADLHLTVVGLSNNESFDPDLLVDAVLKMVVTGKQVDPPHERVVASLDAPMIARFTGEYAMDAASRKDAEGKMPPEFLASLEKMSLTAKDGGLVMLIGTQLPATLFLGDDGLLFTKDDGVTLEGEPAKAEAGAVKSVVLRQGPFTLRWKRVKGK
jgi:CubicO group peptidase (beta-lactamase class C family)